jgi:hypothetical protein
MRSAMVLSILFAVLFLAPGPAGLSAQAASSAASALPRSFRGISLGMDIDQVKKALLADALFGYRGDPDVSMLPQSHQYLIECAGHSYIRRAYFQFADKRLLTMILVLDAEKLDYFSLYSALSAKYGQPTSLSPQEAVWQSDSVRLSLERPLTVKYIDQAAFTSLVGKAGAPSDLESLSKEKFIEQF